MPHGSFYDLNEKWVQKEARQDYPDNSADNKFSRFFTRNDERIELPEEFCGNRKYSILMASDFSTPKFGGVETHTYNVCQCLMNRGHKVVYVSVKYGNIRSGVRTFANGMRIYHIPVAPVFGGLVSFFVWWQLYFVIRQIIIREQIDIVHCHTSTAVLGLTCINVAKMLGIKSCLTEHSLFNYGDMAGINLNKLVKWSFRDLDAMIAVS